MKKHDEGYVLVYVTVVLLVFCLVAATILTGAHNNLQNQQRTNEKIKQQYIAAGEIEKVMAQLSHCTFVKDEAVKISDIETAVMCIAKDTEKGTVTLYTESGAVSITCVIQISDGKYLSYEVGTATPEMTVPAPSTIGGAAE